MNITVALYNAVHNYAPGLESLAAQMGISANSLRHKVNPLDTNAHCSPLQIQQICAFTGDMGALYALSVNLGHASTPIAIAGEAAGTAELAQAMKEASDVFVRASETLADGKVTANEQASMQREVLEAIGALVTLMARINDLHESGKPKA